MEDKADECDPDDPDYDPENPDCDEADEEVSDEAKKKADKPIKIDKVVVTGGINESVVRNITMAHMDELKACAAKEGLQGKVVIKIVVGPDGTIKNAQVVVNEIRGSNAEKCIMEKVKAWRFPGSQDRKEAEATVVLVFPG
jgi:Ca-activated chloride channel family protein